MLPAPKAVMPGAVTPGRAGCTCGGRGQGRRLLRMRAGDRRSRYRRDGRGLRRGFGQRRLEMHQLHRVIGELVAEELLVAAVEALHRRGQASANRYSTSCS